MLPANELIVAINRKAMAAQSNHRIAEVVCETPLTVLIKATMPVLIIAK